MSKRAAAAKESMAMEEDLQMLMDGIINEDYVRQETGKEDLTTIQHLSLVIDTSRQSVYDLHVFLPNLQHLVLDNSTITSIRDLGIGLRFLTSLSLSNCSLIDIDGIGVLTGLLDLCLSDNEITDVTPLAMHENLQNLNLSGNRITDISVADSLSSCLSLKSLFLSRNPLCKARNYRLIIASIISGLKMLDGKPVDPDAAKKVNNGMILESAAELRANEEDLDDEMRLESEILESKPAATDGIPDTGSELTHGSSVVLAGNVAAAVRRRRNASETSQGSQSAADRVEHESTLDILDAAIGRSDSRNSSRPGSNQAKSGPAEDSAHGASFYREGDITSSHAGAAARFAERASLRLNTTGEDNAFPADGSASPQVSSRSNYGRNRNGSGEFAPKDAPSPAPRSSSQWSSGRRGNTDVSMSFDMDTSLVGGQNLRPKTSGGVSSSGSFKLAAPSPTMRAASPLQRNSSRPQSAASVGSNSPQMGRSASTQAAPFKVAVDKTAPAGVMDETTSSPSALTFPAIRGSSKGSSIVHLDIVKRPTGSYMIAEDDEEGTDVAHQRALADALGDDDSDTEDIAVTHAARHRLMFASSSAASANSVTSNLKARQQILQRLKSTSSKDCDADHTPADRCKTPPTAASRAQASTAAASAGIAHASPRLEMGIAERGSARKSSRTAECVLESLENSPQRPPNAAAKGKPSASKDTLSSKAGMSLGFHLAGSLAAIDKWVQDMNSEDECGDEDDEDEEEDSVVGAVTTGKLITSFALPEKHFEHDAHGAAPSGLEGNSKDSCSDFSSASKNSRSKILSRDTILSMCSNSGRGASRGSQDMDEDSDLDEPDLELYRQAQREEPRRAAGATASAAPRGDSKDATSGAAQSTAGSRSRNADVLNRVNSNRTSTRTRPGAADSAAEPADMRAPAEAAEATAERRRPKPRAVPDFPPTQAAARDTRAQADGPAAQEEAGADTASPPRHTAPAIAAPRQNVGAAGAMSDEELVELLKQKPKNTLVLRTTSNFQEFFSGVAARRMQELLRRAYADVADATERKDKIDKRMKLLENVLS